MPSSGSVLLMVVISIWESSSNFPAMQFRHQPHQMFNQYDYLLRSLNRISDVNNARNQNSAAVKVLHFRQQPYQMFNHYYSMRRSLNQISDVKNARNQNSAAVKVLQFRQLPYHMFNQYDSTWQSLNQINDVKNARRQNSSADNVMQIRRQPYQMFNQYDSMVRSLNEISDVKNAESQNSPKDKVMQIRRQPYQMFNQYDSMVRGLNEISDVKNARSQNSSKDKVMQIRRQPYQMFNQYDSMWRGLNEISDVENLESLNSSEDKEQVMSRRYFAEEELPRETGVAYIPDNKGEVHCVHFTKNKMYANSNSGQIYLYLYSKYNKKNPEKIAITDYSGLAQSEYYNSTLQNLFICHGWRNNYLSDMPVLIKTAVLKKYDVNVFVLDWSIIAETDVLDYLQSAFSVKKIGDMLGNFINQMMDQYSLSPSKFNLVGHSLGAHVAGCAGSQVKGKVNYIVALDPASAGFSLSDTENRIDITDAAFVEVIHTSVYPTGFMSSIGHADFYPNDGYRQPGCGIIFTQTCSHSRAYQLYADSISSKRLIAHECSSYTYYKLGLCNENRKAQLGGFEIDKSLCGDFYLTTRSSRPYGKG